MSWFGKWFKVEAVVTEEEFRSLECRFNALEEAYHQLNKKVNQHYSENMREHSSIERRLNVVVDRPVKPLPTSLAKELEEPRQKKARETEANSLMETRRDDGVDTAIILASSAYDSGAYDSSSSSSYDSSSSSCGF